MELGSWTLVIGLGISAGAFALQDHDHPDGGDRPRKLDVEQVVNPPAESSQEEIKRLFGEVERRLKSVDVLLTDAAAGDTTSLEEVEEAGIAELLTRSLELGSQLQADIARILELAEQPGGG